MGGQRRRLRPSRPHGRHRLNASRDRRRALGSGDAFRDNRLRVTGEVTNVGTVDITQGRAAAVFLDGEGNIIGTADDGSLGDIRVGETKAFTITIATDILVAQPPPPSRRGRRAAHRDRRPPDPSHRRVSRELRTCAPAGSPDGARSRSPGTRRRRAKRRRATWMRGGSSPPLVVTATAVLDVRDRSPGRRGSSRCRGTAAPWAG
jgi:hypothetical protein